MLLWYIIAVIRRPPHFSFLPDLTPPESIGHNVLVLTDIQESATYTCVAANEMGRIENTTNVIVKGNVLCCCSSDRWFVCDSLLTYFTYVPSFGGIFTFNALTVLVGHHEEHHACKN